MSMHDKRPIPTAVLVPASDAHPERPAPKRKAGRPAPQVPWVQIIAGGSAVWVVVVLVMALYAVMQERSQPTEPPIPANAVVLVEQAPRAAPPRGRAEGPQAEPFDEGEAQPAPGAPKLPFRDVKQAKNDDAPLALEVFPEVPVVAKGPPNDLSQVKKAGRADVDPDLFVNCDQIGTDVLFMKNPADAFKRARAEKKMVFMVHLSGNLEDKDFT